MWREGKRKVVKLGNERKKNPKRHKQINYNQSQNVLKQHHILHTFSSDGSANCTEPMLRTNYWRTPLMQGNHRVFLMELSLSFSGKTLINWVLQSCHRIFVTGCVGLYCKGKPEALAYLKRNIACLGFSQHKHGNLTFQPSQNNQNRSFK